MGLTHVPGHLSAEKLAPPGRSFGPRKVAPKPETVLVCKMVEVLSPDALDDRIKQSPGVSEDGQIHAESLTEENLVRELEAGAGRD